MKQIRFGLEKGLNINSYLDPFLNWEQMREIRLGLEKGLDVSIYAKSIIYEKEMKIVRNILENKLDISWYKPNTFSLWQLDSIVIGLQKNLNPLIYANPNYSSKIINVVIKGLENKIDLTNNELFIEQYIKGNYFAKKYREYLGNNNGKVNE